MVCVVEGRGGEEARGRGMVERKEEAGEKERGGQGMC